MKSIYYYWYAKKRLDALNKDLLTMGDDNPMLHAQGDMIELEIAYYKEQSIKMVIITLMLLLSLELLGYLFWDELYKVVSDIYLRGLSEFFYLFGGG